MLIPNFRVKQLDVAELQLLNTALTLFIRVGMEETSMSHVIKSAGLKRSQMYQYFASKQDLYCRMILVNEIQLSEQFDLFTSDSDPMKILKFFIKYKIYSIEKYNVLYDIESTLSKKYFVSSQFEDWKLLRENNLIRLEKLLFNNTENLTAGKNKLILLLASIHGFAQLLQTDYFKHNISEIGEFNKFTLDISEKLILS